MPDSRPAALGSDSKKSAHSTFARASNAKAKHHTGVHGLAESDGSIRLWAANSGTRHSAVG
jgi:hypothetical protein